eukprot:c4723_g1_i1.p1 GENE.c4723_g1_i1~~c4723_g1_i1.p1  ORF type:complete len:433 (-),score=140.76 c4723_g1_i1:172-1470(-)
MVKCASVILMAFVCHIALALPSTEAPATTTALSPEATTKLASSPVKVPFLSAEELQKSRFVRHETGEEMEDFMKNWTPVEPSSPLAKIKLVETSTTTEAKTTATTAKDDKKDTATKAPSASTQTPKRKHENLIGTPETKITIVTPTYPKDLCKFKLQCHNVMRFHNGVVGEFVTVWLDKSPPPADFDVLKQQMATQNITFTTYLMKEVVPMADSLNGGWLVQQSAKLRIAALLKNKQSFLVLDSKNIPTRPMQLSDFQSDKRSYLYSEGPYKWLNGVYRKWYLKTHEVLKFDWPDNDPVATSITPLIMHTATVNEMIPAVEAEMGMSIEDMISGQLTTEICLYNVWVRREGLVGQIHDIAEFDPLSRVVWRGNVPVEYFLDKQRKQPSLFFGVHREWQRKLNDEERPAVLKEIRQMLGVTPDMTWVNAACFE